MQHLKLFKKLGARHTSGVHLSIYCEYLGYKEGPHTHPHTHTHTSIMDIGSSEAMMRLVFEGINSSTKVVVSLDSLGQ